MLLTTNEEALLAVSTCRGKHSSSWQHQLNSPGSHQEEIGIQCGEQVKAADWFNTSFLGFISWRKGNKFVLATRMVKGIQSICLTAKVERVPQCSGAYTHPLQKHIFCSRAGNLLIHKFILKSREVNLLSEFYS